MTHVPPDEIHIYTSGKDLRCDHPDCKRQDLEVIPGPRGRVLRVCSLHAPWRPPDWPKSPEDRIFAVFDEELARARHDYEPSGHLEWLVELRDRVFDAIPDGWAKLDGEWAQLRPAEDGIGDRCYYVGPEPD